MKKLLSLALILLCFFAAAPTALAAGQTYELPELNMTIDAPKGWYVLTKDVKEGDPDLVSLGLTGQARSFASLFNENGIYLDMINRDDFTQIFVVTSDVSNSYIYDFNELSDEDLLQIAAQVQTIGNYVNGDYNVTDYSIYKNKQGKYAIIDFTGKSSGISMYANMYVTVKNGKTISIIMVSVNKISGSLKKTLKNTVDSAVFTEIPRGSTFPAEPATYELTELNMTIDSPGGWYVSTWDIKDDDPNLILFAGDKKRLADYYKENGICLYVISYDINTSIAVKMEDMSDGEGYVDFNHWPDEDLLQTAPEMLKEGTLLDYSVYNHEQTKFVVLHTEDGVKYVTLINGYGLSIEMELSEGKVTDSLEETLKGIVDSIKFTKVTSTPGPAEPATYELSELNMAIDSPEGWYAFTRYVDEENPGLVFLGKDSKEIADEYKENDIYLDMISEDPNTHIVVMMKESDESLDIYDCNDMADEDMLGTELTAQGEKEQTLSDTSIYKHKQAKFAVFDNTNQIDGETCYGRIYLTVINGQAISIKLQSRNEIQDSLKETLQDIVESITFTKVTSRPVPEAPAPKAYPLPELNMILGSPEGWFVYTRDIDEDDPYLKALGIDGSALADYYENNGIYLEMESADPSAKIFIMEIESDAGRDSHDFNNMSGADMMAVAL